MSAPDDHPIILRRQNRPAPAYGPKATPRPAPVRAPKPTVHGLCARCREHPGEFLWTAHSPSAIGLLPKLLLCRRCTQALRSMLDGYINKIRQKAAAKANGQPS